MIKVIPLLKDTEKELAVIQKIHPDEPDMILTLESFGDMARSNPELGFVRAKLLRRFGLDESRFFQLEQVHSKDVSLSDEPDIMNKKGDGLIAAHTDHVLGVTVADCMPVFLFDRTKRKHALVHSGWKGTGIAVEAVQKMKMRFDCKPADITAVLGPSIRSCCYEVDEERGRLFEMLWGKDAVKWHEDSSGIRKPSLDLLKANIDLLDKNGLTDIRVVEECTACSEEFGSFRRQGPERFTHMLAIIGFFK